VSVHLTHTDQQKNTGLLSSIDIDKANLTILLFFILGSS
jgi:hypothetical protein